MIDWTQLLGAMKMPGQTAQQGVRQFGNVFNPQAGLGGGQAQSNEQPEKTPWLNQDSYGGLSKGEMLLAGAGMLSGRDLQQGIGNAAQFAYGSMERNRKKQEEEAKKKQMQMALAGIEMTPEQRAIAAAAPDLALGQVAQSAFAPPAALSYGTDLEEVLIDGKPVVGRTRSDGEFVPIDGASPYEKPGDAWVDVPAPAGQQGYFQKNERTGAVKRVSAPSSPMVQVNTGNVGAGERPIVGNPPQGYQMVWDPQSGSYRQEVIPGSGVATEAENAAAVAARKADNVKGTVGTLIGNYATLAENNAITARGNSAGENIAALYSRTGLGKAQDAIGGEVGNLENSEARQNIEGISMNALMQMISASEVSAKAMDSDAEMKAWLSAIKSDNYEAALTKLHVLDTSFGAGNALQEAYENGVIDLSTYQYITKRVSDDPIVKKMKAKADRYAVLGEAIGGRENMTPQEVSRQDELGDLLEHMSAEERALFDQ